MFQGENLSLATTENDVRVTVGTEICNVTSLAQTQLLCAPPSTQPAGTNDLGLETDSGLPLVVVHLGLHLRFPIGYLEYDSISPLAFPPEATGGVAAGAAFLLLVCMAILLVYRHKSTQADREYKRIQIQMDNMENNVRMECKQGKLLEAYILNSQNNRKNRTDFTVNGFNHPIYCHVSILLSYIECIQSSYYYN